MTVITKVPCRLCRQAHPPTRSSQTFATQSDCYEVRADLGSRHLDRCTRESCNTARQLPLVKGRAAAQVRMIQHTKAASLRKRDTKSADRNRGADRRFVLSFETWRNLTRSRRAEFAGISRPAVKSGENNDLLAGAGGLEPPNGGIKVSLISNDFNAHLEKSAKNALSNFNGLEAVSK
jgi:hypothetical protein